MLSFEIRQGLADDGQLGAQRLLAALSDQAGNRDPRPADGFAEDRAPYEARFADGDRPVTEQDRVLWALALLTPKSYRSGRG